MEEKKPITHLVAGTIIAGVLIIFSCLQYFLNFQLPGANWIELLFVIVGLILFVNLYGNALNNQVSFGNLFAYGFKTTAFLTLILIAFDVIFFLAFPEFKEKGYEMARQKMEETGKLTPDEIDKNLEMARKFFWLGVIGGTILAFAIIGAIGSLIGAAITKKRPVNPGDQLDMR